MKFYSHLRNYESMSIPEHDEGSGSGHWLIIYIFNFIAFQIIMNEVKSLDLSPVQSQSKIQTNATCVL